MRFPSPLRVRRLVLGLFLGVALVPRAMFAAQNPPPTLGSEERQQVITLLGETLRKHWVFPDMGKKLEGLLLENLHKGTYDAIKEPAGLADAITKDVVALTRDRHFHLFFAPDRVKAHKAVPDSAAAKEARDQELKEDQEFNFGFQEVRILDGNVGYIRLDGFSELASAADTAAAAMAMVRHTDALILDLRRNHGGYTDTLQFLASYAFEPEATLLYTEHSREGETEVLTQYSTLPYVPGARRPQRPLYILTSSYSFSAAEALPYYLKNRKKAVVVGEITGGGAHPWTGYPVGERFFTHIPTSRTPDPVTQTDWEEVGVVPDIEVPASKALTTAHLKAVEGLLASTSDNQRFRWAIPAIKAQQRPAVKLDAATLQRYAGAYGERLLSVKEGRLVCDAPARQHLDLIPLEADLFACEGVTDVRIKVNLEKGVATGITMLYANGQSRVTPRNK